MRLEELNKLREKRVALDKRIKEEERKIELHEQLKAFKNLLGGEYWPDLIKNITFVLSDGSITVIEPDTILYSKIINCIRHLIEREKI